MCRMFAFDVHTAELDLHVDAAVCMEVNREVHD